MTARDARCVVCVAKHKSVSKAARELFVTQQALSKTVDRVEGELGVRLFDRLAFGMAPTDFGNKLLPVLASLASAHDSHMRIIDDILRRGKKGFLISFEHKYLPALIPVETVAIFDEFDVTTRVAGTVERCAEDVAAGRVDVGVCHRRDGFAGLEYVPFVDEPACVIVPRGHPYAGRGELELSDLRGAPMVEMFEAGTPQEVFVGACIKEGFYPNVVSRADSIDMLLAGVRSHVGIAIAAKQYVPAEASGGVACVPLRSEAVRMAVGFLVRSQASRDARAFVNAVVTHYAIAAQAGA
jgi:DNA-binding transcriptional LysR family regulator